MDDCLRCHAMHFEGGIRELVTPLDRKGPWTFVNEADAGLPAVPCLTCHSVHRDGEPFAARSARMSSRDASRRSCGPRSPSTIAARSSTSASTGCRCRRWSTASGR